MVILAPSYQPKYSISGPLTEKKRAVFLDRDGVINVNYGYVHHIDNFEFIDGSFASFLMNTSPMLCLTSSPTRSCL